MYRASKASESEIGGRATSPHLGPKLLLGVSLFGFLVCSTKLLEHFFGLGLCSFRAALGEDTEE